MRQLTDLDASFLYLETANAPMHISGLAIYDQSTAPGGVVRFKDIVENTNSRVTGLPIMTQKLVTVPMNMDHPLWELYIIEGLDNVEGVPKGSFDELLATATTAGEKAA